MIHIIVECSKKLGKNTQLNEKSKYKKKKTDHK